MTDAIRWELADTGVLTLSFDRPEVRNAIDTAGQSLLLKLLADAARHPRVKVVVLAGTGASFCTGADVRSMGAPDPGDAIAQELIQTRCSRGAHLRRVRDGCRRLGLAFPS